MSEATALRDLPPVEPIEVPRRFSQTLLRHANRCKRSAYLYARWKGGAPSSYLDRGTAAHEAYERAINLLVEQGEHEIPPEVMKDIQAEVIAQRSDLTVPAEEQGRLRVMAQHFAEHVWIEPSQVVAVERKFVLPIDEQFTVSGKIDFASIDRESGTADIWDWKTAYAMTEAKELEEKLRDGRLAPKSFQLLLYILLLAFGHPVVDEELCPACNGARQVVSLSAPDGDWEDCATCNGVGKIEHYGEPLGDRINVFSASELYPQFSYDDGMGRRGPLSVTRPELLDHRMMLEGLVYSLAECFETWKFEATPGSHCQECPARAECPLPSHLRSWAGEINSIEQAKEASEWLEFQEAKTKALKKELRNFATQHGDIPHGADQVRDFRKGETRTTNWEGVEAALERAVEFGEPFSLAEHQRVSTSNTFRLRKRTAEELEAEGTDDRTADEKWGTEAPF